MVGVIAPKPRVARCSSFRKDPHQLVIGDQTVFQAELVQNLPGGKQSATRLRHIRETMEACRYVKPGAIPIAILWPFAPVRWVYDLSDTYGKAVPPHDTDPFKVLGAAPGARSSHTTATADRLGVKVELTNRWGDVHAGLAGVLHETKNASTSIARTRRHRWFVLINESLDINARFATLVRELGHIYCGHLGTHPEGFWPDRSGTLTKQQREIEAEAVAFLVCKRLELKTRPAMYLRRHVTVDNLTVISKRLIIEATNRIEARS